MDAQSAPGTRQNRGPVD
ncbi:hypothetical protein RSAG8_08511, partial [Rhizoctonia solani AG-8 WAC10335]